MFVCVCLRAKSKHTTEISDPAGTLGLAGWPSPGEEKRAADVSPNLLLDDVGDMCISGEGAHGPQESIADFKADIRVLVNAPSACPPDPQIWPLGKI